MIPEEVRKEHMAICNKCKERKAVAKMVDFHVDWLDCFWDCPNDYEHWIWEQVKEYCNKRCLDIVDSALRTKWYKEEPHIVGKHADVIIIDEPQTERSK